MVDISTLSGITKTDHVYEVTSEIDLAAEYDDIVDSFIVIKSDGALRHKSGCVLTYRNCLIIEEPSAESAGPNNYNNSDTRYGNGCDVQYINCDYIIAAPATATEQRGFDISSGADVRLENFRCLHEENTQRSFNHLNSAGVVIINATFENLTQQSDGRRGVPFEQNVNYTEAPDRLTIIDPRDDTTPNRLWVVLLNQINNADITVTKLKIIKADGTLNDNLQVLGLWQGNKTDGVTLIDPYADLAKVTGSGQADGNRGNLVVKRTYKGKVIDLSGDDLSAKINIQRLGFDNNGTIVDGYEATANFSTSQVDLTITGVSDSRSVLAVGDPVVFTSGTPPSGIDLNTTYFLRPHFSTANRFYLTASRDDAISGSTENVHSSSTADFPAAINLVEQIEEIDDDEWNTTIDHYRSGSHQTDNIYRDRYVRSVTKYGYQPDIKTFTLEWSEDIEDGLSDGNVTLREDPAITEDDESVVSAYTEFTVSEEGQTITITADTDLDKLVDYIQYYAATNPELEYIRDNDFSLVEKDGSVADLGDIDITIDSDVTLSEGETYNSLITTGTITNNGDIEFSFEDSTGIAITLQSNIGGTMIHYDVDYDTPIDESSGREGHGTANSDGKYILTGIPSDSHVYIAAKKDGYDYYKTDFDPAATKNVSILLSLENAVDLSVSISSYGFDEDATENDNNIFLEYNSTGKSNIVFGEIDLDPATNARRLSNRVFDHLFSTVEGLRFLNHWNRDNSITSIDGRPYLINENKIVINSTKLEFVRMASMTAAEKSYFGQYVETHDSNRYRSPQSNNDNVSIASESNVIQTPVSVIQEAAEYIREEIDDNSTKLQSIYDFLHDPIIEHVYVLDGNDNKIYGYDLLEKTLVPSLGFQLHADHGHPEGLTNYNGLFYVLNAESGQTQEIGVYTARGARLEYREFDLHSSNASATGIAISNGKLYVLDDTSGSEKVFVYSLSTRERLSSEDFDISETENPLGIDVYNGFAYITDSRDNPNSQKRVQVYNINTGSHDSGKSFTMSSAYNLLTGVVVTEARIRVLLDESNNIQSFTHEGTHRSEETITLDSANSDGRGMAIIRASLHDLAIIEADFSDLLSKVSDIEKFQKADIEVNDNQVIFSYDGETLATFDRRTSTTDADYSGGRTLA